MIHLLINLKFKINLPTTNNKTLSFLSRCINKKIFPNTHSNSEEYPKYRATKYQNCKMKAKVIKSIKWRLQPIYSKAPQRSFLNPTKNFTT